MPTAAIVDAASFLLSDFRRGELLTWQGSAVVVVVGSHRLWWLEEMMPYTLQAIIIPRASGMSALYLKRTERKLKGVSF